MLHIHVWSDYVCPFCYLEEPILRRLEEEYDGQLLVRWHAYELRPDPVPLLNPDSEYVNRVWDEMVYPMARERGMRLQLPPVQPRSRRAFEAVEFARSQGRFDEMHQALFQAFFRNGLNLNSEHVLLETATTAGLDPGGLRRSLRKHELLSKVIQDEEIAAELGISAVPTMVIQQPENPLEQVVWVIGAQPYELLHELLDAELHLQ